MPHDRSLFLVWVTDSYTSETAFNLALTRVGFWYHYIFLRISDNTKSLGLKSGIKESPEEDEVGIPE